ncbi:small-conductance mechanosensitive channel [Candidatus Scalindua japonica]|uniref:Small-conductance mechanosensitive channel n=1 Tax=Candidatus Scalindua japonica TaxID=1284222 RepID=A0A286U1Y0_9BACT|nr:hypothetical protein [Candidatus Scalindua japonica]GAX62149.1 small-conductance mechanosensitive channel [Candidatus Scalindua japonica]
MCFEFLFFGDSYAQRGIGRRGGWGWGAGFPCCPLYNTEKLETIKGAVVSVDEIIRGNEGFYGIHLTVQTDEETVTVHLGPGWYIENQDMKIEAKEKVEITGSKIFYKGKAAIIAYEVRKGDDILVLRDANGFPAWRGWRRLSDNQPPRKQGMQWKGGGGWGPKTNYGRMYNPETVETISGEITNVDKITPGKGMSYGIHVVLKTDGISLPLHLGPGWYIENQDMIIEQNDKVEVTGSRITFDGKPAMIAAKIKKGDEVLMLRDENGIPAWSGWRRR